MLGITLEGESPRRSQRLYERYIPANLILELWLEDGSKRFLVEGQPIDLLCGKAGALRERTGDFIDYMLQSIIGRFRCIP